MIFSASIISVMESSTIYSSLSLFQCSDNSGEIVERSYYNFYHLGWSFANSFALLQRPTSLHACLKPGVSFITVAFASWSCSLLISSGSYGPSSDSSSWGILGLPWCPVLLVPLVVGLDEVGRREFKLLLVVDLNKFSGLKQKRSFNSWGVISPSYLHSQYRLNFWATPL